MHQISQKPPVVHQVSAAEPAKAEVEQIDQQPIISCQQEAIQPQETAIDLQQNILEMSEKQ
jgi:hypothetical protein